MCTYLFYYKTRNHKLVGEEKIKQQNCCGQLASYLKEYQGLALSYSTQQNKFQEQQSEMYV